MPSFLSQSAICCIAATNGPVGADRVFRLTATRVYADESAIAPFGERFSPNSAAHFRGRKEMSALPPFGGKKNKSRDL
jgi:hypothetical protein